MYTKKKCIKCGQPATHKFTRIEKGEIFDIFLCTDHAAEMSPYQKPKIPLSDILEGLLKQDLKLKTMGPSAPSSMRCKTCGLPFEAYRKNLLLGCSDCYVSFREYLIPDLRKFHGDTRHYGRQPGGGQAHPSTRDFPISELESESAGLVSKEDVVLEPKPSTPEPISAPMTDPKEQIDELIRVMHMAIAEEDYTKAAYCRDRIRDLQTKSKKKTLGD